MSDAFVPLAAALIVFALGMFLGWTEAHSTVATECQRLGSFYVGKQTFECKVKP